MTRPYCGYFWAVILTIQAITGLLLIIQANAMDGMNWLEWLVLPAQIAIAGHIIRLIWRP